MNPIKPSVEVTLRKQTFQLVFDYDAIALAEELTGKALILGMPREAFDAPTINRVRAMFYACTRAKHPDITYEHVKALINSPQVQASAWVAVIDVWNRDAKQLEADEAEANTDPTQDQK
jgi:hypothetical protein